MAIKVGEVERVTSYSGDAVFSKVEVYALTEQETRHYDQVELGTDEIELVDAVLDLVESWGDLVKLKAMLKLRLHKIYEGNE